MISNNSNTFGKFFYQNDRIYLICHGDEDSEQEKKIYPKAVVSNLKQNGYSFYWLKYTYIANEK